MKYNVYIIFVEIYVLFYRALIGLQNRESDIHKPSELSIVSVNVEGTRCILMFWLSSKNSKYPAVNTYHDELIPVYYICTHNYKHIYSYFTCVYAYTHEAHTNARAHMQIYISEHTQTRAYTYTHKR